MDSRSAERGDLAGAIRAVCVAAAVAGWSLLAWWQVEAARLAAQRHSELRAWRLEQRDTLDAMQAMLRRLDQRTP